MKKASENQTYNTQLAEINRRLSKLETLVNAIPINTNKLIAESVEAIGNEWTPYTPDITNMTLGSGFINASYCKIGKVVHYRFYLQGASDSTFSGMPSVSFPFPLSTLYNQGGMSIGRGIIRYSTKYLEAFHRVGGGLTNLYADGQATSYFCHETNFNWTSFSPSNFWIYINGTYQMD